MVSLVGGLPLLLDKGFSESRALEYTYLGCDDDAYLYTAEVSNFGQ